MKNNCSEEIIPYITTLSEEDFVTNNCEYFYFITGIPCNYLSTNDIDYLPGGSIYQTIQEGTILAYVPSSGIQMESLSNLIAALNPIKSICSIEFLTWPDE